MGRWLFSTKQVFWGKPGSGSEEDSDPLLPKVHLSDWRDNYSVLSWPFSRVTMTRKPRRKPTGKPKKPRRKPTGKPRKPRKPRRKPTGKLAWVPPSLAFQILSHPCLIRLKEKSNRGVRHRYGSVLQNIFVVEEECVWMITWSLEEHFAMHPSD